MSVIEESVSAKEVFDFNCRGSGVGAAHESVVFGRLVAVRAELMCSRCGLEYVATTVPARKSRLFPLLGWEREILHCGTVGSGRSLREKVARFVDRLLWQHGHLFDRCPACGMWHPKAVRFAVYPKGPDGALEESPKAWWELES